jgi:hypothetical protein
MTVMRSIAPAVVIFANVLSCKTDAVCHNSDACQIYGICTGNLRKCVVGSDADCAQSVICGNEGLCTAVDGRCRATEGDDCRRSEGCRLRGECRAYGVACFPR